MKTIKTSTILAKYTILPWELYIGMMLTSIVNEHQFSVSLKTRSSSKFGNFIPAAASVTVEGSLVTETTSCLVENASMDNSSSQQKLGHFVLDDSMSWVWFKKTDQIHTNNTLDERKPAAVEVGSFSHYLQGFIHPRWCMVYARKMWRS